MLQWLGAGLILAAALLTRRTLLETDRAAQRTRRALAAAFETMESEVRALLTPLLRYMINPSYATLDYNVPFVRKTAGIIALGVTSAIALGISAYKFLKSE